MTATRTIDRWVEIAQAAIEAAYRSPSGDMARVWVCHACDGVGAVAGL